MKDLMESKAFCNGVTVGIHLHQQQVKNACKNKEALNINGETYYVQSGRELMQEMINRICE